MNPDVPGNSIFRKVLRFSLSGLLVTALHVVVAIAVIEAALITPAIANGIAFLVSTFVSYLINTLWSFSRAIEKGSILRFALISCLGLVLSVSISGFIEMLGFHYSYGIFTVVCFVPIVSFLCHNYWTYQ